MYQPGITRLPSLLTLFLITLALIGLTEFAVRHYPHHERNGAVRKITEDGLAGAFARYAKRQEINHIMRRQTGILNTSGGGTDTDARTTAPADTSPKEEGTGAAAGAEAGAGSGSGATPTTPDASSQKGSGDAPAGAPPAGEAAPKDTRPQGPINTVAPAPGKFQGTDGDKNDDPDLPVDKDGNVIPPPPPAGTFQGVDDEKSKGGDTQPPEVVLPVGPNANPPQPATPPVNPSNPQNPVPAGSGSGRTGNVGQGQDVNTGADGNQGTGGQTPPTAGKEPNQGEPQQGGEPQEGGGDRPTAQFAPNVSVFQPVDENNPAAGSTPVPAAEATIVANPNNPAAPNQPVNPNNPNQPVDPNNPNAAVNVNNPNQPVDPNNPNQPGITPVPSPINLTPGANGQPTVGPITAMTVGTAMGEKFTMGPSGLVVIDGTTFNTATPTTKTLANGKTVKIGPTGVVSIQDKVDPSTQSFNKDRLFISRSEYIIGSFLPTIIAVLFTIPWHILASALKEMEPFYQLSSPSGARADKSLALTYRASINVVSTIQAIGNGHYLVWWSGLLSLVALVLAPLSSETIFIAYLGVGECDPLKSRANCIPQVSVYPVAARVVQAVLSFMAVLCFGLIIVLQRKKSGIYTNPLSIASLAALFQDAKVIDDFRRMEGYYPPEAKDLRKSLKGQVYKVGEYTDSLGNAQYGLHSLTPSTYATGIDNGMRGGGQEKGIVERSTSVFSRSTFRTGKSSKYTSVAVRPIDEEDDRDGMRRSTGTSPQPTPAPFSPTSPSAPYGDLHPAYRHGGMGHDDHYGSPDPRAGVYSLSPPPGAQPPPVQNTAYEPYSGAGGGNRSPPPQPVRYYGNDAISPQPPPYHTRSSSADNMAEKTPLAPDAKGSLPLGEGPPDFRRAADQKRKREWFTLGTHSVVVVLFAAMVLGLEFLIVYYNKLPNTKAFERFMTQGSFGVNFLFTSLGVAVKMYWGMIDDGKC